ILCDILSSAISLLFSFSLSNTSHIYSLSLHDALPISYFSIYVTTSKCCIFLLFLLCVFSYFNIFVCIVFFHFPFSFIPYSHNSRSEEHTSELQSRFDLVCRLLLEKK